MMEDVVCGEWVECREDDALIIVVRDRLRVVI